MQRNRHSTQRAFTLVLAAIFVSLGFSSADASTVYVLRGGNPTSDAAPIDALTARGHLVTSGVESVNWDGTQEDLSQYDVVLILNNFNWSGSMPIAGRTALVDYVVGGGGIVTSEWLNYYVSCSPYYVELAVLMPAICLSYNSAPSTDYSQVTADAIFDDGLPGSFRFDLADLSGSESSFAPKEGAVVFFSSSNGGGTPNSAGVVGWDVMGGRAINFSTLVTNTELSFAEYRQLLGNAANWARVADLAVTNTGIPDPVQSGAPITYTITASNNGPSIALAIALTDELSVHTTFQSLAPPQGWSCNTPPVGETGTVTCTKPSAGLGEPEIFTLVANVNVGVPEGTSINNTATIGGSTFDPNPDYNSATATVTVSAP